MSKHVQLLLEDREFRDIQRIAQAKRMTVAKWVGQALRAAAPLVYTQDEWQGLDPASRFARVLAHEVVWVHES